VFSRSLPFILFSLLVPSGLCELQAQDALISDRPSDVQFLPRPTIALEGGLWFDGKEFVASDWYSVDGKFTRSRPDRIDVRINLRDRYVLPPLAEAHNHNLQNAWSAQAFAGDYLRRGIFYTAQMAANSEEIAAYRGLLRGPASVDVLWAEATLSSSDGHPLGLALGLAKQAGMALSEQDVVDKSFWAIDDEADLEAKWPRIAEAGPKLVKVIVVDEANSERQRADPSTYGQRGLNARLLPLIVRKAHGIGARVAAHVDSAADIDLVVTAGVDIVAHMNTRIPEGLSVRDLRLSNKTIETMRQRGTVLIPTVAATKYYLAGHPEHREALNHVIVDNLKRLKAAGVAMLTGSDLFDGSVIDEIEALAATGVFSPAELLNMATCKTPQTLFPERRIGAFGEGAEASLVVYENNPLANLTALRSPRLALKQGEILSR
jgi:hypothetical protein